MNLSVLSIAYPLSPVAPQSAGGAEQILRTLEAELVARGHESTVVARTGSEVAGALVSTLVPDGPFTAAVQDAVALAHQVSINLALDSRPFDLVHMHGLDFTRYVLPQRLPVVVTLHLPPAWYPESVWSLPPNIHLVCVSKTQYGACRKFTDRPLSIIPNGVPEPQPWTGSGDRGDACLMLSRICPEKNLHAGFEAARLAGRPVLLAGETFPYPAHLDYLRSQIQPRLGPQARLHPPADAADKMRLLAGARCLLVPSLAPETSSLVAMEALYAGTPVIAFRSGALPEIIDHGRTGFLVDSTEEMAAAIARVDDIDPDLCRSIASRRFSLEKMVQQYLDLYQQVLGRADSSPMTADASSLQPEPAAAALRA